MAATADLTTSADVHVGRQPILDRDLEVLGYELLYRASADATGCYADAETASAVVLANSLLEFGLETLTGGTLAFFNCGATDWSRELFDLLPQNQVVLEVLESNECDDELEAILRQAQEKGYRIALDDVDAASYESRKRLLPFVDIVKLEFPALSEDELRRITKELQALDIKVLAEKVETQEDFALAQDAGCDYFQGYFFAKPKTLSGRSLPQAHIQTLQLLSELADDDIDLDHVASRIAGDAALSVRILRYANSAAVGCRVKLPSIQRAVAMVGLTQIRKWAQVIAMSGLATNKPSELLLTALMRARFCELVAGRGKGQHPAAFTVGLLSLLDAMLDCTLDESFRELHLSDELSAALLRGEGELGQSLQIARAYESFDWDRISELAPNESHLSSHLSEWFVESMSQAQAFYQLGR